MGRHPGPRHSEAVQASLHWLPPSFLDPQPASMGSSIISAVLNRLLFPAKIQQLQPKPLHLFPLWPDLLGQLFLPIFSRSSPAVLRLNLALPESPAASCRQTWWALVRCTLPPSRSGAPSSPACTLTGNPCFPSSLASQPALASLLSLGVSPLPPPAPQSTLAPPGLRLRPASSLEPSQAHLSCGLKFPSSPSWFL